jgi:DNA polymerase I-like protein with 3'-5' exonuclease and polymerase domains
VYEVKESVLKKNVPEIQTTMESVLTPKESNGIKFSVETSVGENWGEMKKYNA